MRWFDGGRRAVEPVKRRGGGDRVHRAVVDREGFGGSIERASIGHDPLEHRAHRGNGLDRDHGGAAGYQLAGQFPRAGGDVQHRPSRPELQLLPQPSHGLGRVAGPPALVRVGSLLEADRREKLDKLTKAADQLRDKFGFDALQFGGSLHRDDS